jgi:hypothetical protein
MNPIPLEQLTYASFAALVKTRFRVRVDAGHPIELELTEAKQFQPQGRQGPNGTMLRNEGFSLMFNGPASTFLQQKIYDFEHDKLGAFSLFLVPIGRTPETFQYEVIFNRLT